MEQIMRINADYKPFYLLFIQIKPPFKCDCHACKINPIKTQNHSCNNTMFIETKDIYYGVHNNMKAYGFVLNDKEEGNVIPH
ncbi:MAG: hypothetical protein RL711_588 [Bacteroidota bacterium]